MFVDGDFVFGHTEYDFASRRIGFEVFRFEGEYVVEHWDDIQERKGPNSFGHSMVDGPTEVTDLALTEANRKVVTSFVDEVFVTRRPELLANYVAMESYTEHSPEIGLPEKASAMEYQRIHRVLAEGDFVLTVCEGDKRGTHMAFYDLSALPMTS